MSEAITPLAGTFSPRSPASGEPSLPEGFRWRGRTVRIAEILDQRKWLTPESFSGENYVRRHRYRLRMEDGTVWSVYFVRHPPRGGGPKARKSRWFLQTVEREPPR